MLVMIIILNVYYFIGVMFSMVVFLASGGPPSRAEAAGFALLAAQWPKYIYRYVRAQDGE